MNKKNLRKKKGKERKFFTCYQEKTVVIKRDILKYHGKRGKHGGNGKYEKNKIGEERQKISGGNIEVGMWGG